MGLALRARDAKPSGHRIGRGRRGSCVLQNSGALRCRRGRSSPIAWSPQRPSRGGVASPVTAAAMAAAMECAAAVEAAAAAAETTTGARRSAEGGGPGAAAMTEAAEPSGMRTGIDTGMHPGLHARVHARVHAGMDP